eukprot:1793401-Karenia_brevis.AAC.1
MDHMQDMTLPPAEEIPRPLDRSVRRGYAAWLDAQTRRAQTYVKYMRDVLNTEERTGHPPQNRRVGFCPEDPFDEGRTDDHERYSP